jgi:hypothetical protein
MRYLSKIVFINTADKSLRYAEVELDGNVHFIGTQGVGKSTLLRAILFFYNADTQKLGIPREKKNYNEYYFPYQNSYIVYEVQTETGTFCVMSFKSQGRVAFRFFDSEYSKQYFIDEEGKAFETWDKTRDAFGKNIGYTRIINSYEEYRNILYGNNKGLSKEFRKYALLESKQYQNIPRTISNVFLNAKLDAEFVKQTIIKSLNEDEVKIDLATYSQTHLRDFETNLNDIKKWTDKNRNGENLVENQAEKVATTNSALRYLEEQKKDLAFQLGYAMNHVKEQKPKIQDHCYAEELKRDSVQNKLNELDTVFEKKRDDIQKKIGEVSGKLKDIFAKRKEYLAIEIESILARVAKKPTLALEQNNLLEENKVLTSQFIEIQQRYEAQFNQLKNQLASFENKKQTEKNLNNSNFINYKEELHTQYDQIYEDIKKQHKEELEASKARVHSIEKSITNAKIKQSETRHKRFYETEIENCKADISALKSAISTTKTEIEQAQKEILSIQREWAFEEKNLQEDTKRKVERQLEEQELIQKSIAKIASKIENSKNSLYAWLNENVSDWDKTIGKVIDEEQVLFQQGLNPKLVDGNNTSFYGIHIDLSEINKNVKTVADLQQEQEELKSNIQSIQQNISEFNNQSNKQLENLKRKFKPKVKEQKESIQRNEYLQNNKARKLDERIVQLSELEDKARTEQKEALQQIEKSIFQLSEEKTKAEKDLEHVEHSIAKTIRLKKKEKEKKIKIQQKELDATLEEIEKEIEQENRRIAEKTEKLKAEQKKDLDTKGADTKRIEEIELRLAEINTELVFIDNNRDKVAEYNKDKRELFDKEDEFKNQKKLLAKQLETEADKHQQQKAKLEELLESHKAEIKAMMDMLSAFQKDSEAFESFSKSDIYPGLEHYISSFSNQHNTEQNAVYLVGELYTNDNTFTKRYVELQEAINKFTGNFEENNLYSFKVKFAEQSEYFEFAEMLKEFVDENKISEYKKRVEERFAHIIRQIGRETNALIEKEGEISKVISEINNDFVARQFVTAVKSVELKTAQSANPIFQLLVEIKNYNDENTFNIGTPDLFTTDGQANKNEKAISLLKQLIKEMASTREKEISLSDSFELLFKIVENDNDTGWVEKLTNVGSEGTDVLVKAMINIMLLNVFKEKASKKQKDDFRLHCMMDEIGKLHPNNVKGILKFANDRNILLINSSPTSLNATDYRYTYLLSKNSKNLTSVKRLVKKISPSTPKT